MTMGCHHQTGGLMSHTSSIGTALALAGTRLVALQRRSAGCGVQGGWWPGGFGLQENMRQPDLEGHTGLDGLPPHVDTRSGYRRDATSLVAGGLTAPRRVHCSRCPVTAFSVPRGNHTCRHTTAWSQIREAGIQLPPLKGRSSSLGDLALFCFNTDFRKANLS